MNPANYLQTYSVKQLERIAREQLKKLRDLTIPVDIETIVEDFHKIDIDVKRGLKEHHHLWGMVGTDLDTGDIVIVVDDQLLDLDHLYKIYRMTIAEELAHVLLHRGAIKKVKNIEDFKALQSHSDWDKHDRNAKRLAAALLMPAENVLNDSRELYKQMVGIAGYDKPEVIKKCIANKLAEDYEVSVYAMKLRLGEWPIRVTEKIDQAMQDKLDFLE